MGALVVDEAGMVGTRDLAELEVWTLRTKTKLVLVGDHRQLPEIDAGGAFRGIAERIGAVELTEVRRQDLAWDRRALSALRDGKPAHWAAAYVDHARVKTAETAPAIREQLVDDWWTSAQRGLDARMIAMRRADVADLNQRARERMRGAGRLDGVDVDFDGKPFAIGDDVVVTHNDRRLGVLNGDRATITHAERDHINVTLDRGDEVWLPRTLITDGHLDHGYATTAHKAQGSTVDEAFVLGSQEAYREWGYTALSRHRAQATYYLAAPQPFVNQEPDRSLDDAEQLKLFAERNLDASRQHELAVDLADRYGTHPATDDEHDKHPERHPATDRAQRIERERETEQSRDVAQPVDADQHPTLDHPDRDREITPSRDIDDTVIREVREDEASVQDRTSEIDSGPGEIIEGDPLIEPQSPRGVDHGPPEISEELDEGLRAIVHRDDHEPTDAQRAAAREALEKLQREPPTPYERSPERTIDLGRDIDTGMDFGP